MRKRALPRVPIVVALAVTVLAACAEDEPIDGTAAPPATATPGPLASLRDADFTTPAVLAELFDRSGAAATVEPSRVHFEDLAGADGVEEAVVFVESGGTAGDLGAAVYHLEGGRAVLLQYIAAGGRVVVRLGLIVTQEGVYASDDAQCCPSQLRETAYGWNGEAFEVVSQQVVRNEQ
jgi:hypothetical protein